jgi:Asp-tRNA(Asn)/Glu-tRNA(Gln) amidotransferase A subunit family amidase
MFFHNKIFETADAIVTPMTGFVRCDLRLNSSEKKPRHCFALTDCDAMATFAYSVCHLTADSLRLRCRVTAYPLQEDALATGELDYINGAALVRYSIAGNFLGLPAITVPVGYDRGGLPVGLQFIGRPWSEATLLHLAYAAQEACAREHRKPKVQYDLLVSKD